MTPLVGLTTPNRLSSASNAVTLRGLHWRNADSLGADAFEIAQGFDSFVVMSNMGPELPLAIHERWPDALIIARLYWPAGTLPTMESFVEEMTPYIKATQGVTLFYQILNEPDLEYPDVAPEDFCSWWAQVADLLKEQAEAFPNYLALGFPMPSIQGDASWDYIERCKDAMKVADFLAERGYWQTEAMMDDWNWGSRYYRTHNLVDTPIHLTEFGNSANIDTLQKAAQYYHYLNTLPPYVLSANGFIQAGAPDWDAKGFGITAQMAKIMLAGQGIVQPLPGSQPQAGGLNDDDEGGDMAQYVLGFKDLAERLGASVVGEPEMDEASIVIEVDMVDRPTKVYTFQTTTTGRMEYVTGGQPKFYPAFLG